jgi:Holliday junction resolvase
VKAWRRLTETMSGGSRVPDRLFPVPPPLSERQFQDVLQQALTREGWSFNHIYRTKVASGAWRTSTTAVGFPDLLAVRGPHILAIEVKSAKGRVRPEQLEWLARFATIPTGLAWLLEPRMDWQAISNWLHNPGAETTPKIHGWTPNPALTFTETTASER